jgi:two-component system KDP operon response regulator KdpE
MRMKKGTAVLVEDEPQIRKVLKEALETEDWRVFDSDCGQRGMLELRSRKPDLLVLDLGLPDMDGIELVKAYRSWSSMPILVVSARSEEVQKVRALDEGADDFITKPFGISEFLARVRAMTRRRVGFSNKLNQINFGEIEVDLLAQQVKRQGSNVHLTPIEYRLLSVLIANEGKIVSQQKLLREVWGPNSSEQGHYLRIYMGHLRHKLEIDPAQPQHLITETGIGYRLQTWGEK